MQERHVPVLRARIATAKCSAGDRTAARGCGLSLTSRAGTTFLPGGAVMAEKSSRTSMRLSFGLVEPQLLDEGVRRLAVALREVRRRGRAGSTGALS